jgi:acetolactate synthase-1/3 small subunit
MAKRAKAKPAAKPQTQPQPAALTARSQPGSAYFLVDPDKRIERHTMAVMVINEPGVLARVIGLFSGRGYNIESLTVAPVSEDGHMSLITIVTTGTPMVIEQIRNQLDRLVPVESVKDLTLEGPHVERELAMVKVVTKAKSRERAEILRLADIFGAIVVDTTTRSFVFAMTGLPSKVDSFVGLMRELGQTEIARSGVVAIARGA